jgi:hypothetical protein
MTIVQPLAFPFIKSHIVLVKRRIKKNNEYNYPFPKKTYTKEKSIDQNLLWAEAL